MQNKNYITAIQTIANLSSHYSTITIIGITVVPIVKNRNYEPFHSKNKISLEFTFNNIGCSTAQLASFTLIISFIHIDTFLFTSPWSKCDSLKDVGYTVMVS